MPANTCNTCIFLNKFIFHLHLVSKYLVKHCEAANGDNVSFFYEGLYIILPAQGIIDICTDKAQK